MGYKSIHCMWNIYARDILSMELRYEQQLFLGLIPYSGQVKRLIFPRFSFNLLTGFSPHAIGATIQCLSRLSNGQGKSQT